MISAKNKLDHVLQGINNAIQTGFNPLEGRLKINCVIKKNINDNQILNLVHFAKAKSIEIRFIEYMDVGNKNNWQANEVLKSHELISIIKKHFKINETGRLKGNTAHKWYMKDSNSYISTISSICISTASVVRTRMGGVMVCGIRPIPRKTTVEPSVACTTRPAKSSNASPSSVNEASPTTFPTVLKI